MTREIIEDFRSIVIPYMVNRLKELNYEGLGESDAKEFEREFNEILNLAIKALEQEPTTKNDLGVELISRADAIKAMQDKAKKLKNEDTINGLCGAVAILFDMPSVTPQPTKNDLGVDYISRAEAIKCLECDFDITGKENMKTVVNYINSAHDKIVNLPRVKQESKTGHWIETHDDWGNGIITDSRYKCSVCHGKHIDPETGEWHEVFDYKYPFCPNCGAKMAESKE